MVEKKVDWMELELELLLAQVMADWSVGSLVASLVETTVGLSESLLAEKMVVMMVNLMADGKEILLVGWTAEWSG